MLKLLSIFGLSTTHETITWSDKPQRDPVYMTAKIYDKDATCSGSSSSPLSAIMTNICANINSTMSANIRCASPAHCIESMYKTGDCTGTATFAVDIVTDGKCNELKDPVTGKVVYGQFSQVDLKDAIKSMHKPYLAVWNNDATCGGAAYEYMSGGECNSYASSSFETTCTAAGVPQSCYWQNSSTCTDTKQKGRCSPMTGFEKCKSVPDTTKTMQYVC